MKSLNEIPTDGNSLKIGVKDSMRLRQIDPVGGTRVELAYKKLEGELNLQLDAIDFSCTSIEEQNQMLKNLRRRMKTVRMRIREEARKTSSVTTNERYDLEISGLYEEIAHKERELLEMEKDRDARSAIRNRLERALPLLRIHCDENALERISDEKQF